MIYFTILYFTYLTFFLYNRKGIHLSTFFSLLYLISTICSLYVLNTGMEPYKDYNIGLFPSLFYCSCVTMAIIPSYHLNLKFIDRNFKHIRLYNFISYLYIFIFFLLLFLFYQDIISSFVISSVSEGRKEQLATNPFLRFSGLKKYLLYLINYLCTYSYLMILFFLYSIVCLKKNLLFNILLLISSLSPILMGVLMFSRTNAVAWMLFFVFSLILFLSYFNRKQKKYLLFISAGIVGLVVAYFTFITWGRFEENAFDEVIRYGGISYLNFCHFWNGTDLGFKSLYNIFPVIHRFILHESYSEWEIRVYNSIEDVTGTFTSFVGDLVWTSGPVFTLLFLITISFILTKLLKRKHVLSIGNLIIVGIYSMLPMFGIIWYFFHDTPETLPLIVFVYLSIVFNKKGYNISSSINSDRS